MGWEDPRPGCPRHPSCKAGEGGGIPLAAVNQESPMPGTRGGIRHDLEMSTRGVQRPPPKKLPFWDNLKHLIATSNDQPSSVERVFNPLSPPLLNLDPFGETDDVTIYISGAKGAFGGRTTPAAVPAMRRWPSSTRVKAPAVSQTTGPDFIQEPWGAQVVTPPHPLAAPGELQMQPHSAAAGSPKTSSTAPQPCPYPRGALRD